MYVEIGKYKNYFGPYQLTDLLKYVGVSAYYREKIAEWIPSAPFEWIYSKRKRHIHVQIDPFDTWSMDHTLSLIILPMLLKFKDEHIGSPFVADEDVPDELKSTSAPPTQNEWDTDDNFHRRWDWVLDEMIFAFDYLCNDGEDNLLERNPGDKVGERVSNGFRLFGVYFRNLWD